MTQLLVAGLFHVAGRADLSRLLEKWSEAVPAPRRQPGSGLLDTVAVDKTHRQHAVIEQVHSDLKNSALAHLPSGVFTASAAWLVLAVIAFNLTRAAGTVAAPDLARGDPPRPSLGD